ncbi:hypothetical protein ACFL5Z_04415 [Planctomycetota bacterium]
MLCISFYHKYFGTVSLPNWQDQSFSTAEIGAPSKLSSLATLVDGMWATPPNGFSVFMNNGGQEYYNGKQYRGFAVVSCISDMTVDEDAVTAYKSHWKFMAIPL